MPTDVASLRERAVRASARGRPTVAVRMLTQALEALDHRVDDDLQVRLRISLAHAVAETGHLVEGLSHLDLARQQLDNTPSTTRGLWYGQRGLLLLRAGRHHEAATDLATAAQLLVGEPAELARVLLNRGVLHLRRSDLTASQVDFARCRQAASTAGLRLLAAKAASNEGYVAYLRGDLPVALAALQAAEPVIQELAPTAAAITLKDRAEVLVSAGLLDEAAEELHRALRRLRPARLLQDRAEAELALARVELSRGRQGQARRWARRAADHFAARGASGWTLVAQLHAAHAELGRHPERAGDAVAALAPQLRAHGLVEDAAVAHLLHAAAMVRTGRVHAVPATVVSGRAAGGASVGTRMLALETRAAVLVARGDVAGAQRVRRRGLDELTAYQSRFGSMDLVTAASAIGGRLASEGLVEALRGGRIADVLSWSERVRASSSRISAVRPGRDDEHAADLARLRHLRSQERALRLAGEPVPRELREEAQALERAVRRRAWHRPGPLRVARPVGPGAVRDAVGADGALVSLMVAGEAVHALTVTRRHAGVRAVADVTEVREAVLRLRADLDALTTQMLPDRLRAAVAASLRRGLAGLGAVADAALDGVDPGGPVAMVPSGLTAQVPWPLLDRLRGRPVCVVPSATWWTTHRSSSTPAPGRTVLVAGPEVPRAVAEVRAIGAASPAAVVLTGEDATVAATLQAADGAEVLHVAAHGRHAADNPLFSSLLLADGWLFGHDLDLLHRLPRHVVLSACETGRASIRPGDEALGMTAALLYGGSRSVVSAVARLGDETAEAVAVAHHRALTRGEQPAVALAGALEAVGGLAPTVCFGAGW